jgi:hypothetical protein
LEELIDQEFSWKGMPPQYLIYRYLKLSQNQRTIPAISETSLNGVSRKLAAGLMLLTLVPEALLKLKMHGIIGGSRLFVLHKHHR